jgi:hypothetical protein
MNYHIFPKMEFFKKNITTISIITLSLVTIILLCTVIIMSFRLSDYKKMILSVKTDTVTIGATDAQDAYYKEKTRYQACAQKRISDLAYTKNKLVKARQMALAGLEDPFPPYEGLPGLEGERGYTYEDTMALNQASADLYNAPIIRINELISGYTNGTIACED